MASRVWLLVEWVDENNVFPSYCVVNVDTVTYSDADLTPGNLIFIKVKHENPKRAKILRISENKHYVKEQKEIMERQDKQVKNVLQLCMRTIKEMKSDHSFDTTQQSSSRSALSHVIVAKNSNSESDDSDTEVVPIPRTKHNRNSHDKLTHIQTPKYGTQYIRKETRSKSLARNSVNQRRSMVTSSPLPAHKNISSAVLYFDQATQTEGTYLQPSLEKIEEMETVLKNLYSRFQSLVAQVNSITPVSEPENNDEVLSAKSNERGQENGRHDTLTVENINGIEEQGNGPIDLQKVKQDQNEDNTKLPGTLNSSTLQVRRMSAQTTNNIETMATNDSDLVPIGNGNAKVPARLLNEIDWNWHTSATRQLLQAIFPRKVLATHSLTGKQSPAFLNRPPKKILDPKIVDDIVLTVSTRCGVPKNLVRNSITIKCTDEAKLYRNRQQYKQTRTSQQNVENVPPSTPSSDESRNLTF